MAVGSDTRKQNDSLKAIATRKDIKLSRNATKMPSSGRYYEKSDSFTAIATKEKMSNSSGKSRLRGLMTLRNAMKWLLVTILGGK